MFLSHRSQAVYQELWVVRAIRASFLMQGESKPLFSSVSFFLRSVGVGEELAAMAFTLRELRSALHEDIPQTSAAAAISDLVSVANTLSCLSRCRRHETCTRSTDTGPCDN